MAIPLPQLPSVNFLHPTTHKQPFSLPTKPSLPQKPYHDRQRRLKAMAKDESALSSMITSLEKDQLQLEDEVVEQHEEDKHQNQLASRWREIHGRDSWTGLLNPLDPLLRTELIRYGEMAQACYDAFVFDPFSTYCGCCKYSRRAFFQSLGMGGLGYDVSRYLYATSSINLPNFFRRSQWQKTWSQRANWIGYIAVSDDETTERLGRRDIVVAWRGTVTNLEFVHDLMNFLRPVASEGIPCPDPSVKVEAGFVDLYTDKDPSCRFCRYSAREQVLTEISKLVSQYTEKGDTVSITMTGHSLGSALAKLSAYDVAESGLNVGANGEEVPICVVSISGPRVGNERFQERFEGLGIKAIRVVNVHDMVPKVPGILFNEHVPEFVQSLAEILPWSYRHVGVELALDHKKSPFLKETGDPSCYHNLEAHLHLLDGYRGPGESFALATSRDPALINKASNFLKDHHMVPPNWRQDENKGMIRTGDGRWIQPEHPTIDDHPEHTQHHLKHLGLASDDN